MDSGMLLEMGHPDAGMLVGIVFLLLRLAVLAGVIYVAVVEIMRERRKK